ncbi:MAG: T9SS type A sorting domain-containing protein, partial [bacterium]
LVILKVYDLIGRELQILVNKFVEAGTHSVNFDASDLSSGMYIYKLQAGDLMETRKMLLMR